MLKRIRGGICVLLCLLLAVTLASNLYALFARKVLHDPAPAVFGVSSAVVVSGSMSGTIEVDDMIFTKACRDYAVGDIILFRSGSSAVTHRIVERTEAGFITKGDANNAPDPQPVKPEAVVGKVVAVIPGMGLVIGFLQTPQGFIGVGVLLVLVSLLSGAFEKRDEGGDREDENRRKPEQKQ